MLATISKDGTARLWNTVARQAGAVLRGHADGLTCGWLHPDGSTLLTGSDDGSARAWALPRGNNTLILTHKQAVTGLAATPDGR